MQTNDSTVKAQETRFQRQISRWKIRYSGKCLIEIKETALPESPSYRLKWRIIGRPIQWGDEQRLDNAGRVAPTHWERIQQRGMIRLLSVQEREFRGRKERVTRYELIDPVVA